MNDQRNDARSTGAATRRSWRGRAQTEASVARHRWQRDWTAAPAQRGRFRRQWQSLRLVVLLVAFAGLLGFLTYLLLQAPTQTPLLAVALTSHDAPLPVNAFAYEDLKALEHLDRKSIAFDDLSNDWKSAATARESLASRLRKLARDGNPRRAVILYLSLPGAVDGQGRACLIPPDGSVVDDSTWLPLEELLQAFQAEGVPDKWNKLLVLDCTREPSLYAAGIITNPFAERAGELVQRLQIPGLAVLVANQPAERAWTSPELGQSVFGHYFQRGLGGEADFVRHGGDGNRRVSMAELYRYVQRHVDAWARQRRSAKQRPQLYPSDAQFDLVWVTRNGTAPHRPVVASVSDEQRAEVHERLQQLDRAALRRVDPVAWHQLQTQALRLDTMAMAGEGYAVAARRLRGQLEQRLEQLAAVQQSAAGQGSDVALRQELARKAWFPADPQRVHSLPLATRLAAANPTAIDAARRRLRSLAANPQGDVIAQAFQDLGKGNSIAAQSVELQTLRLLDRFSAGDARGSLGTALEARLLAEEAAAPLDVRAWSWLRPGIDQADERRRRGEDALFAGEAAVAEAELTAAVNAYRQTNEASERLQKVLMICDRACEELPAWSAWLMQPRSRQHGLIQGPDIVSTTLLPAINDMHVLARQLAQPVDDAADGQRLVAAEQIAGRLQSALDALESARADEQRRLLTLTDEGMWAACVGEIEYMLALPQLSAGDRQELLRRRESLLGALTRQPVVVRSNGNGNGSEPAATIGGTHPLLALLEPLAASRTARSDGDPARSEPIAARAAQLRKFLREVDETRDIQPRPGRTMPEHAGRLAAALGVPAGEVSVVAQQRCRDWQGLWAWQAKRALDDFLGPATPGSAPFFSTVAQDYLEQARIALPDMDAATQQNVRMLAQLHEDRLAAARQGVELTAENSLVLFPGQAARTHVEVAPGSQAEKLPAGRLALAVQSQDGVAVAARFVASGEAGGKAEVKTPLTQPAALELVGESLGGNQSQLQVLAHLRGNPFTARLMVRAVEGPTVEVFPTASNKSRITVAGSLRKRPAVIFVLDCSKSMERPLAVEASDGDEATRLKLAKDALQTMLNQLARDGDALVGVKFIGHRVGWTVKEPLRIARQTAYGRPIPENVAPHEDVESALTLGRFDALHAGEISGLLDTVVPWGQSPLYLGVMEAVQELAAVGEDADANVIAITDGTNYQFLPSTTDVVPAGTTQTLDDVLRALEGSRARVHIVGFGVPREEAAEARDAFQRIARASNGTYQPIDEAGRLIPHLASLLGPSNFEVSSGRGRNAQRADLGRSVTVDVVPQAENAFDVAFRQAREQLVLRGGEHVTLRPAASGERLEVRPFAGHSPLAARLVTGEDKRPTEYLLMIDRPLRTTDGVQLTVSLRHQDDRFVARPAEVWIEATPRRAGVDAGPAHVYYDTAFVDGESSPVITWTAHPWPRDADQVAVRCWVRPSPADIAVVERVVEAARAAKPRTDPALSGHSWMVEVQPKRPGEDTFEVRVATWEQGTSRDFPAVKAMVAGRSPGTVPLRIERVFDAASKVSVHRFQFSATDVSPEELDLQLIRREAVASDAWQLGEAVNVAIDTGLELVPPQPLRP